MLDIANVHRCEDSGKYQFRQEVPVEFQELVGKKVIKRSLNTPDEDKLRQLVAEYSLEYEAIFEKLRDDKGKGVDAGVFSYVLYCLRDQI